MTSGVYRYPGMDRVIYGRPFADVLGAEVDRLEARAVYVLASGSLARDTEVVTGIRRVLGNRCAGVTAKIGAHTPRTDVVEAANAAREAHADLILTVGGGSVTDAAKMVGLCLGNDVTQPSALDAYRATTASDGSTIRPPVKAPAVRFIAIPTTLSAGEFNASAGCTDTARHVKESFALLTFGIDRIMFSVDYPYAPNASGRAFLDRLSLAPADMTKLAHGNADALLKLEVART
jgi:maleylacetate reductase